MFTSYSEAIEYMFSALPMFHRQGAAAYKNDLSRTQALDAFCGHPHRQYVTLHIGGTNGKGSTANMLASILQEAGYTVGLFTSPHISDFRERIRIQGECVSETYVVDWLNSMHAISEELSPSFFEFTTAMAFQAFADYKVDIAVIEVGMGGRLDCTNIIQPICSVITNISLDHTQFLGDTKEAIAMEKAGIIKPKTPVVIGRCGEVGHIFDVVAKSVDSPVVSAEDTQIPEFALEALSLRGRFQHENLRIVLQVLLVIQERFPVEISAIANGLQHIKTNTGFRGRLEVLSEDPYTIVDVGHNIDGMQAVLQELPELFQLESSKWHIVLSFVADKDRRPIFALLPKDAQYYVAKASIPRGLEGAVLGEEIRDAIGAKVQVFDSVEDAYTHARIEAKTKNGVVFVGGSFFTMAEVV